MKSLLLFLALFSTAYALSIGVARTDLTPPIGTPSAGYYDPSRKMVGSHDPLTATALVIESEGVKLAFCAVDHLGFDHSMVEEIRKKVPDVSLYIGSSHTHSGSGAYLSIPLIGEMLAGPFDPLIRERLIDQTAAAILKAVQTMEPGEIGFGYGSLPGLNFFRSECPMGTTPPEELTVIKCVNTQGKPLAILFNFAVHPTTLSAKNTLYSADFVGYAREVIESKMGGKALFFNGSQAEVMPLSPSGDTEFERCASLGAAVGEGVNQLAQQIGTSDSLSISLLQKRYAFTIEPTSEGLKIPIDSYDSEINAIIFNEQHAFVTIPGELSALFIEDLQIGSGYPHLSILGLTNDAHGYILRPEAYCNKTPEARLSFGGAHYGNWLIKELLSLLSK